jgi:hypothetical protein
VNYNEGEVDPLVKVAPRKIHWLLSSLTRIVNMQFTNGEFT